MVIRAMPGSFPGRAISTDGRSGSGGNPDVRGPTGLKIMPCRIRHGQNGVFSAERGFLFLPLNIPSGATMAVQKLSQIDPHVVQKMKTLLPTQTPDIVMQKFGIGVNTWIKVRNGEAIRHSVAERLMARLEQQNII